MPYYCHQVSYTTEAWHRLLQAPQDRFKAVRDPILSLGGKVQSSFLALGQFDVLAISKFPVGITQAAIAVAFSGGGSVATIQTTPILTLAEFLSGKRLDSTSESRCLFTLNAFSAAAGR